MKGRKQQRLVKKCCLHSGVQTLSMALQESHKHPSCPHFSLLFSHQSHVSAFFSLTDSCSRRNKEAWMYKYVMKFRWGSFFRKHAGMELESYMYRAFYFSLNLCCLILNSEMLINLWSIFFLSLANSAGILQLMFLNYSCPPNFLLVLINTCF